MHVKKAYVSHDDELLEISKRFRGRKLKVFQELAVHIERPVDVERLYDFVIILSPSINTIRRVLRKHHYPYALLSNFGHENRGVISYELWRFL